MVDAAFRIETLRALDLFGPLSADELESIRPAVRVRTCSTGDIIMQEGTLGDELFILLIGQVRVVKNHRTLEEAVIATLEPLEEFGEMSLLSGGLRTATVIATDTCRFLTLTREALEGVLLAHPETCVALLRHAYSRIARLSESLTQLKTRA